MKKYYVHNKAQLMGDHEVHEEDCHYLPPSAARTYLGRFASCRLALEEAARHRRLVNGCKTCCRECYTA